MAFRQAVCPTVEGSSRAVACVFLRLLHMADWRVTARARPGPVLCQHATGRGRWPRGTSRAGRASWIRSASRARGRARGDPFRRQGSFLELFRGGEFLAALGYRLELAQANCSVSRRGVIRGIHFADVPPGQAKYVSCLSGAILDVAVDLRTGSPAMGSGKRSGSMRRTGARCSYPRASGTRSWR